MVARMMLRGLVAVLIGVAVVSRSAPARADAAEVEALIAKGNELRRAGTPGPALPYFQKAYELARTPRTTAQLGLAELAAGYPVEAAQHIGAALQSPNDPSIVKYRGILTDALAKARAQIGELSIQGSPAGADVVVDGRVVGQLPLSSPIEVVARSTQVEVRAPGYTPHTQEILIAPGQRNSLTFDLKKIEKASEPAPVAIPAASSPPPPTPAPAAGAIAPAAVVHNQPASGGGSGSAVRTSAWIVGGAAVAAAGTGLVLNLVANSKASKFDAACTNAPMTGVTPDSGFTMSDCQDRYDTWQSYRTWSLVGYVSGAALAVTSGILFWTSRPGAPAGDAHARLTCAPTPNGGACRTVF